MSLNQTKTNYLYVGSAVVVILLILALVQATYQTPLNYKSDHIISVKTSVGLIKMNQDRIADELQRIYAELLRHERGERAGKFREPIEEAMLKLRTFIAKNPKNNLCTGDIKANIVHQASADLIAPDSEQLDIAYKTILDGDSNDYSTDTQHFSYLLKNLDVLIQMLRGRVCEDGVVDLEELEDILYMLDSDLMRNNHRFETPIGQEIGSTVDFKSHIRLPLFLNEAGQMENFTSKEVLPHNKMSAMADPYLRSIHNVKKNSLRQEQSSERQTNRNVLSDNHFTDEELLLDNISNSFSDYHTL